MAQADCGRANGATRGNDGGAIGAEGGADASAHVRPQLFAITLYRPLHCNHQQPG